MGYSPEAEKYSPVGLNRDMEYKRLFHSADGFEIFESAARKLGEGEQRDLFMTLGREHRKANFDSTIYPIFGKGRLMGYSISFKPESLLHSLGRRLSLQKASMPEVELGTNALPESA